MPRHGPRASASLPPPRAFTPTGSGRHESSQGHGPVSGPASTRTPLHTGEGESKQVMRAPGTPTATDGVAQAAERADRWVQLQPQSEEREVLNRSDLQHPLDGQGLLGDIVAGPLWREPRSKLRDLPGPRRSLRCSPQPRTSGSSLPWAGSQKEDRTCVARSRGLRPGVQGSAFQF